MSNLKLSKKTIPISDIVIDKECYPRMSTDFVTIARYYNAMKAGAIFPRITVAALEGKYYLVDGAHRLAALKGFQKTKKVKDVEVDWFVANSKAQIYELAVRLNATHGKQFTTQEMAGIVAKLEDFKYDPAVISELVRIPTSDLTRFKAKRMARVVGTNEPIALKAIMKHFAGTEQSEGFAEEQEALIRAGGPNQHNLLDTVLSMLEKGWIDLTDEAVVEKLTNINKFLNNLFSIKANELTDQ